MFTDSPKVDQYLLEGCMRCPLGATPDCNVHAWPAELRELRRILLSCGLTETYKWSQPCYTHNGSNIVILSALKDFACLGFFKGVLLQDPLGLLQKPGPNSYASRRLAYRNLQSIREQEGQIKAYLFEAIEIEEAGIQVPPNPNKEPLPPELEEKMERDLAFRLAFEALTPGRQRGYILYFSGAKQSQTRVRRIEKYTSSIFEGKGLNDR